MGLLDSIVGAQFRNETAGRVIVFPGDRRGRGYVVRSEAEELKIKSFLKMFYCAHFSILWLGWFLGFEWSREIYQALGRPEAHFLRAIGIALGVYFLVAGIPYLLFWRAYKKAFVNFVSPQDEVVVTVRRSKQQIYIGVAVIAFAILLMVAVFLLMRAK